MPGGFQLADGEVVVGFLDVELGEERAKPGAPPTPPLPA